MGKIISFMHVSLDGFVAGPSGALDWVKVDQKLFDYVGLRISETDTALYGRNTYQMMESYWPEAGIKPNASKHDIEHSQWYNGVHKVVLSTYLDQSGLNNTTIITDPLPENLEKIKQRTEKDILLFGSPSATQALIQQNLIDGFWLFLNPVILGQGTSLFSGIRDKIQLELLNTKQFDNGVVELNYLVKK